MDFKESCVMAKILVIDHDPKMRKVLQTLFSSKGHQAAAVSQGVEAARLMRLDKPDLILVDQMVSMGGIKTARIIQLNPDYARIPILLGLKVGAPEQTRATLKEAIQHGISWALARPYKPELLLEKVTGALQPQGEVQKKLQSITPEVLGLRIRKSIREISDLPTLSASQQRLIGLMSKDDEEVDMDELIEAIQADQALAMRTLRIARSAGYGYQGNLLPAAVTFLGIQKVRQIIQSATILEILGDEETEDASGLNMMELWKHSIACGMVMQMISRDNMQSKHFMTGLLHDIGKMVLELKFTPFAKAINEISQKERRPRHEIEREIIGVTHAEIGQEIVQMWDLPNELAESIAFHHMPSLTQRHKLLTALVYSADVFVRMMEIGQSGNYSPAMIEDEFAQKVKLRISFEEVNAQREDILAQINAITES